jgi:hypothetical protein
MPMGTSLDDHIVEDPVVHCKPEVEDQGGIYSHTGTLVPWIEYSITQHEAHAATVRGPLCISPYSSFLHSSHPCLYQGPQIILSVDCDAFGLTANVLGIKVPGDPLTCSVKQREKGIYGTFI